MYTIVLQTLGFRPHHTLDSPNLRNLVYRSILHILSQRAGLWMAQTTFFHSLTPSLLENVVLNLRQSPYTHGNYGRYTSILYFTGHYSSFK